VWVPTSNASPQTGSLAELNADGTLVEADASTLTSMVPNPDGATFDRTHRWVPTLANSVIELNLDGSQVAAVSSRR
jgi:hypothetical protein